MFNKYIHAGQSNKIANRMQHWSGSEFDITFHIVNTGMIQDTQSSTTSCTPWPRWCNEHNTMNNGYENRDKSMSNRMRTQETRWEHERWDESTRREQRREEDISNVTMADIAKEYYNNPGPWPVCVPVGTPTPATFLIIQTQNRCTMYTYYR